MRGLDPRIHHCIGLARKMDCRVKPGKDAEIMAVGLRGQP
jgi:hypothetical protein